MVIVDPIVKLSLSLATEDAGIQEPAEKWLPVARQVAHGIKRFNQRASASIA
jgi:hypothetical protein